MSALKAIYRLTRLKTYQLRQQLCRPVGGPGGRLRRRYVLLAGAVGLFATLLTVPGKMGAEATKVCKIYLFQPRLGDICVRIGIKHVESSSEKHAWAKIKLGDCDSIAQFVRDYPKSDRVQEAERRLATRTFELSPAFVAQDKVRDPLYVREGGVFNSREEAMRDAADRAKAYAASLCTPIDSTERLQFISLEALRAECSSSAGGKSCGLNFRAHCHLDVRRYVDVCN